MLGLRIIACVAALLAATALAAAGKRVALVIGNQSYTSLSRLGNPGLDAGRMAQILAASGFEVMSCDGAGPGCFDLSRGEMVAALADFGDMAAGADLAFVFYAGHGMQTARGNVLAPVDMTLSCETLDPAKAVMLDDVMERLEGAREKIVVIDACRNDPLLAAGCAVRGARPLSFGSIVLPESEQRFLIMTSTKPGDVAQDGLPGSHSPFAEALFALMEAEPGIHFNQLFDQVTKRVVEKTEAAFAVQVPEVFIRGGAPETCLRGSGCGGDAQAAVLRLEVEALRQKNARAQEYEEIVVALLKQAGYASLDAVPADQRAGLFKGIVDASRALGERADPAGERALAALKTGDETAAEKLFEEDIAANLADAEASRRKAADSHRHLAALARPKDVAKAARHYGKAAELDASDIQTWMNFAVTSTDAGDTGAALLAYREASKLSRDAGSPSQRLWAAIGEGDIVKTQGRLDRALAFFEAARQIADRHAGEDRNDAYRQFELGVANERIGDVLVEQGNLAAALEAYENRRRISAALAASDPGQVKWQHDLSLASEKVGQVLAARGDVAAALQAHRDSLAIRERLAAADPDNVGLQRDLSVAWNFVGNVLASQGDRSGALAAYRTYSSTMERLAAADPGNSGWQRDLSISFFKIGDMLAAGGDLAGALKVHRDGHAIAQRLAEADRGNAQWQRDLSVSVERIGDMLQTQGDLAGALKAFRESLAIRERLAASDPGNAGWQWDLSRAHIRIGDAVRADGDLAAAQQSYRAGHVIAERVAATDTGNAGWQWDLFVSHWRIARYADGKAEHFARCLEILEKLHAEKRLTPANVQWIEITRAELEKARLTAAE